MSLMTSIEAIEHTLDIALTAEPADLPGAVQQELVRQLERITCKAAALTHRSVSAFDASHEWESGGHKSANDYLKHTCRRPAEAARKQLRHARALRTMPHTDKALAAGTINPDHLSVLVNANRPHLPFTQAESMLVGFAQTLSYRDFVRAVRYWETVTAPDDADDDADRRTQTRSLHHSRILDGMGKIDAWLDPISYDQFATELRRLERQLFDQDWEQARQIHGDTVALDQLPRTPAQRRADALVEMAQRSATVGPATAPPRPLVNIHIDYETFTAELRRRAGLRHSFPDKRLCELNDGTVITPKEAIEQALLGHIRRVVWRTPGILLDVGRKQRLYTGALRDALCIRDRTCRHPSCDLPAENCQADHITEWQDGGGTTHTNAEMLCSYHHRRKRRTTRSVASRSLQDA